MNAPHPAKVAGIDSTVPSPAHTVASASPATAPDPTDTADAPAATDTHAAPCAPGTLLQDRLAGWVSDLTTLHELTERLVRTGSLTEGLQEMLRAGAALVGARRGLVVLEPADGLGPDTTIGLGLARADLGHIETVPRGSVSYGRILDGLPVGEGGIAEPDLFAEKGLDPRHREVAARLGYAASYTLPLAAEGAGRLGAAVWLYDEPAEPGERPRHLAGLYVRYATQHLARLLEVERTRASMATMAEELLPSRLPRVPGVQLAARHHTGPRGGGDWYDALPLPDAALGLAVGSVTGSGPSAVAAMGRLRASLRAYAVMEGEDPVAVLSDLELLLRLTEPARSATALFGYCEPALRRITLAGAGHSPPLLIGERRTEFVETSVSAPLGMLACWEAPSVELQVAPGETVLLYTDGLLHRTGDPADRAFARLHAAAAGVPRAERRDPAAVAAHVLRTMLPDGKGEEDSEEDVVLLAVRFE
ncbi:Magnesium or manganese-dependent protein phosphatase [Streptomyces ambofaciens ATCC 23877]|uniref:Magnesium or manganese-dependent protein phosphatase n=1 Tax=Streptomyces ambofaciens (strain ATCC 23877 / 3486 / DSM 40053 / JCM 4204 / NBRC 12836 / NRRL B-2516) TaxID=278992 RepID=A0A0K2AUR8_STRA7|nr:PP2C family protein-serine/threonine phosphatase [Streptomyces ambofaciens]AKZ56738.1 Magnesium or manganese-dependent protein phosphatase [Streptomyces ambofaciens ATCC 23877]